MPAGDGGRGLGDADLAALGIPTESEYLQWYLQRTGRREPTREEWVYFLVFGLFRLVGIVQGIKKRALQGNASNAQAMQAGSRVRPLAEQAWALARTIS